MSLLNRPSNGLASVLIALYRAVSEYGPQLETDLIRIVAPPNMLDENKNEMAKKTLNRWRFLGFFEVDPNGRVGLAESIPQYSASEGVDLRSAILDLVLQPRNNAGILSLEADDDEKFPDASDFTRAAAWMLGQDPFTFPDGLEEAERLQSEQRVVPKPFINDTRWSGFKDWATFLGLALTPGGRFVPNPAVAVKTRLLRVVGERGEISIVPLLDELKSSLPILDGGHYRIKVESQIQSPWREFMPHEISPTLSVALLSLDASRCIRLDVRSDAQQRTLLGAKGMALRPVSHVVSLRGEV